MKTVNIIFGLFGGLAVCLSGKTKLPNQQINRMSQSIGILLILILACGIQTASQALGVTANTDIVDQGSGLVINLKNTSGSDLPVVNGSGDITSNVQAMYGMELTSSLPSDVTTSKNNTITYTYSFDNKSNTTIDIDFAEGGFTNTGNFGTAWSRNTPSNVSGLSIDGSTGSLDYEMVVPNNAQDGSKGIGDISFTLSNGSNFGAYTGFNGTSYGGIGLQSDTVTTTVTAPDIHVLAKTIKVIYAPTANGYAGHDNDPVPGSIIEYAIILSNQGSYASTTTNVTETIPANAVFLEIPGDSDITEGDGDVNTENDVDYDTNNDGVSDDGGSGLTSYVARQSVNQIRFHIQSISSGQTMTLKYRVTIEE